ncbi:MAG: hypothetical protein Q7V63_04260 [Gammaproteobacteria bacterium]|nr:hypothetical protein [Gammaproteobacteria bacterium]
MQAYIKEYALSLYKMPLSEPEIQQLAWIAENPITTPQSRTQQNLRGEFEISRTINRLYCLQNLWENNYAAFVANQPEAVRLSKISFNKLYTLFHQVLKDAKGLQAIRAASILSSITLSPEAKRRAQELYPSFSQDSVEFSADTIEHCPSIYPAIKGFDHDQMAIVNACFPHHTHFRHMLYTEGNDGMFKVLRAKCVAAKEASGPTKQAQELNTWYLYWAVNMMGFNVDKENPKGSIVLNELMFQDINDLYGEIAKLALNPAEPVLATFLNTRADRLGMAKDLDSRELVAYLANWLGLSAANIDKITALQVAWQEIDPSLKAGLAKILAADTVTPTYGPALFRNLVDVSGGNIRHSIELGLKLYIEAFQKHHASLSNQALSFLKLAQINKTGEPTALMQLSAHPDKKYDITIDAKTGAATLTLEPAPELTATSFLGASLAAGGSGATNAPAPG